MRRRYAASAILLTLLAGHALGQVLPAEKVAAAPFVHSARLGEVVHLPYADLRLTGVAIAEQVTDGSRTVKPAGRYLVMDVEMTARGEPLAAALPYVRDTDDRRYRPMTRAPRRCRRGRAYPPATGCASTSRRRRCRPPSWSSGAEPKRSRATGVPPSQSSTWA